MLRLLYKQKVLHTFSYPKTSRKNFYRNETKRQRNKRNLQYILVIITGDAIAKGSGSRSSAPVFPAGSAFYARITHAVRDSPLGLNTSFDIFDSAPQERIWRFDATRSTRTRLISLVIKTSPVVLTTNVNSQIYHVYRALSELSCENGRR